MKQRDAYEQILGSARHDVELIRDLALDGDAFLESRSDALPRSAFSKEEALQLQTVAGMLIDAAAGRRKKTTTTNVSQNVGALISRVGGQLKQRRFFAEMALVYLVTRLEAFLKDYFAEYLFQDVRRLRSGNTLTYEQALSFSSMAALRRALADREGEKLGYGGIDEVAQSLEKRFNLRISDFPNWKQLREISYRRNLLVHKKGMVDDVYRSKVGYKEEEVNVAVDAEYLATASSHMSEFFEFFHAKLSNERSAGAT